MRHNKWCHTLYSKKFRRLSHYCDTDSTKMWNFVVVVVVVDSFFNEMEFMQQNGTYLVHGTFSFHRRCLWRALTQNNRIPITHDFVFFVRFSHKNLDWFCKCVFVFVSQIDWWILFSLFFFAASCDELPFRYGIACVEIVRLCNLTALLRGSRKEKRRRRSREKKVFFFVYGTHNHTFHFDILIMCVCDRACGEWMWACMCWTNRETRLHLHRRSKIQLLFSSNRLSDHDTDQIGDYITVDRILFWSVGHRHDVLS